MSELHTPSPILNHFQDLQQPLALSSGIAHIPSLFPNCSETYFLTCLTRHPVTLSGFAVALIPWKVWILCCASCVMGGTIFLPSTLSSVSSRYFLELFNLEVSWNGIPDLDARSTEDWVWNAKAGLCPVRLCWITGYKVLLPKVIWLLQISCFSIYFNTFFQWQSRLFYLHFGLQNPIQSTECIGCTFTTGLESIKPVLE